MSNRRGYWIDNDEKNKKLLKELYPLASREKIEAVFPERNWQAIKRFANNSGFKRIKKNAWLSDLFDPILREYFDKSGKQGLDVSAKQKLKMQLIDALNKVAEKNNVNPKKWNTILKHGHELDLSWGAKKVDPEDSESLWEEAALLSYLGEKRTAKELEKYFDLSLDEIENRLPEKIGEKHELMSYRTSSGGQSVYFYHEKARLRGKIHDKIWTWKYGLNEDDSDDHASILISFPKDLDWRQIRVFALAEAYIGSEFHQENRFKGYLGLGKNNPYHHFMINGSLFSLPPRGKMEEKIDWMLNLQDVVKAKLRPIAHKVLWAHQGCTEEKIERILGFDPLQEVCSELGIPYFPRPVMAIIEWNNHVFSFYSIHGTTTAKKRGSMINAVASLLDQFEMMNFIVMSHQKSGMQNVVPRRIRNRVNFRIEDKNQHLIITPSFRKYEGSIEERKGQPLPARGSCAMILFPDGRCGSSD